MQMLTRLDMEDPFHSLVEPCLISSSQEDLLRNCRLARQSDDGTGDNSQSSGGVPVQSAGILMVSLSESDNDEAAAHDEFETPPEELQPVSSAERRTPAVDRKDETRVDEDKGDRAAADVSPSDGSATVELGKDSELGFSGPTSTTKIFAVSYTGVGTSKVSEPEAEKFIVLPRESRQSSGKPPSKKPKFLEENVGTGSPKGSVEIASLRSPKILTSNSPRSGNYNAHSPPNNQGLEDSLVRKKNKKKLLHSPEPELEKTGGFSGSGEDCPGKMGSDVDVSKGKGVENDGKCVLQGAGGNDTVTKKKKIEDLEKFKDMIGSSAGDGRPPPTILTEEEVPQGKRILPLWKVEDGTWESVMGDRRQRVTVLDVLKLVCEACDRNPKEPEETTDILEIAKKRGMTFPRPRWW